jgi:membrane protein YdbS with pleckstrin-like domain
MYEPFKRTLLSILRVPAEPTDPLGAEGSLLVFRAAPGYLRYRRLAWAIQRAASLFPLLVMTSVTVAATGQAETPPAIASLLWGIDMVLAAVLVTQAVVSWLTLRLDYEMRWYKVTDRALRIREGVLSVREMTMTFANVQNVSIEQGPLQRYFGIADLRVQSAGGGGATPSIGGRKADLHSAYFRGVDDAARLRDLVYARLQAARGAGLGDPDDRHEALSLEGALREVRDEAARLREVAARG